MKDKTLTAIAILLLIVSTAYCQRNQKKNVFNQSGRKNDSFLSKQWWLGLKVGPNLSNVAVETPYSVVSPTDYNVADVAKQYERFKSAGIQVTFEATFYLKGFSITAQPTYRMNRFAYENDFEWSDAEKPENRLELNYRQEQNVAYLDWPLLAKYEFPSASFKPYLQLGIYSSMLLDATKRVDVSGVDHASGGTNNFQNEPIIIGATDLFARYHWGFTGGAGLYYPIGNIRLNLDLMYRYGMSNIASTEHRYGSDRLSGVGDSLDDMNLRSLSLSVGCLFPLRFLGSGFKSMTDK
jgi:hypothetical protein